MHRIFNFTDNQYQDAFHRGYDDARRHASHEPPSEVRDAEFYVNATGNEHSVNLRVLSRMPLEDVYIQGAALGRMGQRTEEDFRDFLPVKTNAWRARPFLGFTVETVVDAAFDDDYAQQWRQVTYELSAEGMAPVAPFETPSVPSMGRDLLGEFVQSLKFAVAKELPDTCREVVLTVRLGEQEQELCFPLR